MSIRAKESDSARFEDDKPAKPFMPPVMTTKRRTEMDRAAAAHVEVNRSDPFAYNRVMLYMRRGIELPSDVLAEAVRRKGAGAPGRAPAKRGVYTHFARSG